MNFQDVLKKKRQELNEKNRPKAEKLRDGRNRYRLLPGWRKNGDPTFDHSFGQHFIKDASGAISAVYLCTSHTFGQSCQICDAIRAGFRAKPDSATEELLKEAGASKQILVNMLHRDGKEPNKPMVFGLPASVYEDMFKIIEQYWEDGINALDLNDGIDFIIERSGSGIGTRYSVMVAPKSSPVSADVMERLVDLDDYVKQESEQGLAKALAAMSNVSGLLAAPAAAGPAPSGYGNYTAPTPPAVGYAPAPAPAAAPMRTVDPEVLAAAEVIEPAAPAGARKAEEFSADDLDALLDGI